MVRSYTGQRLLMSEKLAVLGWPIAHSHSPRIHRAAYRELDLPWHYTHVRVDAPALTGFLSGRGHEWRGFSLTMPLKEEARRAATTLDAVARESGAANTLLRLPDEVGTGLEAGARWAGFNTDVAGLAAAMSKAGLDARQTVVIGSGATAVSAILAARRLGAEHVEIVARNGDAVGDLVARFGGSREPGADTALEVSGTNLLVPEAVEMLAGDRYRPNARGAATLIISTLPGPASDKITLPSALSRTPLFDVAYDPWPSPLAERWRAAGGEAHSGTGMLVEQALLQLRIFTSGDPERPLPDEARLLAVMHSASVGR